MAVTLVGVAARAPAGAQKAAAASPTATIGTANTTAARRGYSHRSPRARGVSHVPPTASLGYHRQRSKASGRPERRVAVVHRTWCFRTSSRRRSGHWLQPSRVAFRRGTHALATLAALREMEHSRNARFGATWAQGHDRRLERSCQKIGEVSPNRHCACVVDDEAAYGRGEFETRRRDVQVSVAALCRRSRCG